MDVHPPHEPVHTWRDAFTHLAIVTVGLFIALMLEALVEYAHHRHVVREARENIRLELEGNHKSALEDVASLTRNMAVVKADIRTLNLLRTRKPGPESLSDTMEFSPLDDAAWRTARDTGALAYMPYSEVQQNSEIYSEQEDVNTEARNIAHVQFELLAPTDMGMGFDELTEADWREMLRGHAALLMDLCALRQRVQEVDRSYAEKLGGGTAALAITPCHNLMD